MTMTGAARAPAHDGPSVEPGRPQSTRRTPSAAVLAALLLVGPLAAEGQSEDEARPDIRRLQDSTAIDPDEEWVPTFKLDPTTQRVGELLSEARALEETGRRLDPPGDAAIDRYAAILQLVPEHIEARERLADGIAALRRQAEEALAAGSLASVDETLARIRRLAPEDPAARALANRLAAERVLADLRDRAAAAAAAGRLTGSDGAIELYREVLAARPDDGTAQSALARMGRQLADQAASRANAGDVPSAVELARLAESLGAADTLANVVLRAEDRALALIDAGDPVGARRIADSLERVDGAAASGVRQRLDAARIVEQFPPGTRFRDDLADGSTGPELIVIAPAGQAPAALAVNETTVGEFARFVAATGYVTDAERNGRSVIFDVRTGGFTSQAGVTWRLDFVGEEADDALPVIHVSWNDAIAFADWLAEGSDRPYRLPRDAEFEHAAAAGATTAYWWGDGTPDGRLENLAGLRDRYRGGVSWKEGFEGYRDGHWGPARVEEFPANPLGFRNTLGNVMEWIEDCYALAGPDQPCGIRTLRGGAWNSSPQLARWDYRSAAGAEETAASVGFRVARDLR